MDAVAQRWIDLEGLVNMRDLGGLPTRDGGTTVARRLIRSDNLQDLTDADIARLVDEVGVTDVVDLRTETELHLEGPGPLRRLESLTHHHHSLLPPRPPESADEVAARALALPPREQGTRDAEFWSTHYLGYLAQRPDSVSAALWAVADASGAAVVHCAAGKDRTGTVVAMALDVAGVPREEIVADYVLSAERIERIIERVSRTHSQGPALRGQTVSDQTPRAETMTTILAAVDDGWGGAPGWLRANGWSEDDVAHLRARLTRA
ncbi:tyrosine-protein phosphatase [Phycicoccus endophyticus]|uniref:Tyrosine-protein phosphatase n=1 Tax=Phycicoccus endophyticus TaxID=1690220 RepID=A0A7G9R3U7_9MICO|nr:tyrosine-protein phosphatase [Phycicoccus endophyticus]NHI18102.1 tyrosine-protein phosphatase [Phycicoccus endophyticus]QNN50272.1 tyrosine-protein phosphatase [Phycicoccus endophyticus]GGL26408.1 protein-tyrosine-phosphatase [Phycicoccus endophyticus]